MTRSQPQPSESHAAGKRGRHKRRRSPETARWERDHLIPKRPVWMPEHVYLQLAELRGEL